MFQFMNAAEVIAQLARQNVETRMTDEQFIVSEINRFRRSKRFHDMIAGDNYYSGKHDILHKKRTAIGDDGKLIEIENLPNNKIVDNQYRKMVNQKSNYLVGQPFVLQCDNQSYVDALKPIILSKKFLKMLKELAKNALNGGLGWIHPFYNEQGEFAVKQFKPYEIIPMWKDADHTILDAGIRVYEVLAYEGTNEKVITKVEVFNPDGLYYFELNNGNLIPEEPFYEPYFTVTDHEGVSQGFNWEKIPLIPWKYNANEVPLITMCKSLQDGLNKIESQWEDQMEEDPRNTIMVLVNYDGQNLGEFRKNLATYGAVKVRSMDGSHGDVKTLQIEVNAENYKAIIEQFKKAIVENCMGYDAKDDRIGSNANEMNLKSMYSDIELDTNDMETEFQSAFEELLWFINCHLANTHVGDFEGEDLEIIFNRDIMVNESQVINDIKNSVGILSDETLVAQHPWVDDPDEEMKRVKKQKEENMDLYGEGAFGGNQKPDDQEGKVKDDAEED
jgi:SPP1 family phage portal protein